MERLTIRNSDGSVSQPTSTTIQAVFDKLAAYEDTGLTPEEAQNIVTFENEKMYPEKELTLFGKPISQWFELHKAEQDGRLVVLPCKVGATCKHAIGEIYINSIGEACLQCEIWGCQRNITLGDCIGNCDCEEEAALKGVSEDA